MRRSALSHDLSPPLDADGRNRCPRLQSVSVMSKELLDLATSYGLPGWAVLVIGGGTIVAAVISAFAAVFSAALNVWSARRLALDAAHRERREVLAAPLRAEVLAYIPIVLDILDYKPLTPAAESKLALNEWNSRLEAIPPRPLSFVPPGLQSASMFFRERRDEFKARFRAARSSEPADTGRTMTDLRDAALELATAATVVEYASEGYVFRIRSARNTARSKMLVGRLVRRLRRRVVKRLTPLERQLLHHLSSSS